MSFPERWGALLARRRLVVVGASIAFLALFLPLWHPYGTPYQNRFSLPGAETQKAQDLLAFRFPQ